MDSEDTRPCNKAYIDYSKTSESMMTYKEWLEYKIKETNKRKDLPTNIGVIKMENVKEKVINIDKEKLVTMKYYCQDNDAIIELNRDKTELLISIDGETSQTIISIEDLGRSLIQFGCE